LGRGWPADGGTGEGSVDAPTATIDPEHLTIAGAAMGTAAYMSPEQARGEEVDARTDLFSFGAVLYEMATGKQAFNGASSFELREAILARDVTPPQRLNPALDPRLTVILEKALEKDRDLRYQNAADIRTDLKRLKRDTSSGRAAAAREPVAAGLPRQIENGVLAPTLRTRTAFVLAGAALLVTAAAVVMVLESGMFRKSQPRITTRFSIPPPDGYTIAQVPFAPEVAVSPDGRMLAVAFADSKGNQSLWERPLGAAAFQRLDNTDGADLPFWSPDSQFIGFFADGKLKKIPVTGGAAQTVCEVKSGEGATWNEDGVILFGQWQGPIMRVKAEGGEPVPATELKRSNVGEDDIWPQFLPDGKHFLYYAGYNSGNANNSVFYGSLDSQGGKFVVKNESAARFYPPNHILLVRKGNLLAQPFDPSRMEMSGEPVRISEDVYENGGLGRAPFSTSNNGVLAFRGSGAQPVVEGGEQLTWRDRKGTKLAEVGPPGVYDQAVLSPNGKLVAVQVSPQTIGNSNEINISDHIWLLDLSNGVFSRLTFGTDSEYDPVWSPDSRRILYGIDKPLTKYGTLMELELGSSQPKKLYADGKAQFLDDWSPDGKFFIYHDGDNVTFHSLPMTGERVPATLVQDSFARDQFHFSPDGKWVAYNSDESGRLEVYVASFPAMQQKHQVSDNGGGEPIWRPDGKELYYLSLDGKMMAVTVKAGATVETGPPKALFQADAVNPDGELDATEYNVSKDGQKFLVLEPVKAKTPANAPPEQINVIVNWDAAIK
jgi:eukaryotic-like serine/threonine-protein kinase